MKILVTRPERPARRTEDRLRRAGHDVLVDPLLTLSFHPPERLLDARLPDALVLTSSNGVRAIARHPDLPRLQGLPLWTVGLRTTMAAREIGFANPVAEAPDVKTLADALRKKGPQRLLYIAARVRAGELSELLPEHDVETKIVYTADPASALAPETAEALRKGQIDAVLHYSRRLAEAYLALAAAAGLAREALAPVHFCLSENVAVPLRAAAAGAIRIAAVPREDALLSLLPA